MLLQTDLDNLMDGLMKHINSTDDITGPSNLGNPTEFTMLELAKLVIELTGSRSAIEFNPPPIDDPKQRQPNIKLARDTLGWAPIVPLQDGLAKTIAYFEGVLSKDSIGARA